MFDKRLSTNALAWAKKVMGIRLLGGKCSCGICNPLVLDFHHVDNNKEKLINNIRDSRWTSIREELSKCIVICSNCHMSLHFDEYKNTDNRKRLLKLKLLEIKGQPRCKKCGYKNPCSLDFHHYGEKSFEISSYIFDRLDIPWEQVLIEIESCDVLCRNCHRIEHYGDFFEEIKDMVEEKISQYKERPAPVDKKKVFRLFDSGLSQIEVAREMKCCRSTICMILGTRRRGG